MLTEEEIKIHIDHEKRVIEAKKKEAVRCIELDSIDGAISALRRVEEGEITLAAYTTISGKRRK